MRIVEHAGSTATQSIAQEEFTDLGLLGRVASFFLEAAPRPVPEIALAGAIGYLAGICGNAYNISAAGINQYILYLAPTGVGKDAVADGVAALNDAIWYSVAKPGEPFPHSGGELVSSSGLIKLMESKPCNLTIVGEFGKKLREMANAKNPHLQGLSRTTLQMYSKSGKSGVFDPIAYSDREKVGNIIRRPSLTILGESVPESFYESLDETLIADGLLPRFMVFEYRGNRAYLNKRAKDAAPSPALKAELQNFRAACDAIRNQAGFYEVPQAPDAEALFDQFDHWTTDTINASGEVARQLWNRAHLKALKLAALRAVGENWAAPVITAEHTMWATNLIVAQTNNLVAKFKSGEVGEEAGNQVKQQNEVIRVIREYNSRPWPENKKYHGDEAFHKHAIITFAHIQQRLFGTAAFRKDRLGAQVALERTVKSLLSAFVIREVPPKHMLDTYGKAPRAFCVSDPNIIVNGMNA